LITVINHLSGALHPFDAYVYFALANARAVAHLPPSIPDKPNMAAPTLVVTIDEDRYADEYGQAAPLSRCPLLRDIERIYDAVPAAVVIDLDISPAVWLSRAAPPAADVVNGRCKNAPYADQVSARCQAECEELIYKRLERPGPPATVLMLPFGIGDVCDGLADKRLSPWIKRMQSAGVTFGDAHLSVRFGLVLDAPTGNDSLAEQACLVSGRSGANCSNPGTDEEHNIDSRKYLDGSVDSIGISALPKAGSSPDPLAGKFVFFGGAWDENDIHFTPAGAVYGVDVHAASFATLLQPVEEEGLGARVRTLLSEQKEPLAFLLDVGLGIVFGVLATIIWSIYFNCRFSPDANIREYSTLLVILMIAVYFGVNLLVAGVFSYGLLATWDIWMSPLPVAVGMLVETFAGHPVSQSVHSAVAIALRTNRRAIGRRNLQRVNNKHRAGRKVSSVPLATAMKYRIAVWVKALRRLVWFAIVIWGLAIVFF
jgi:hypothetical protein